MKTFLATLLLSLLSSLILTRVARAVGHRLELVDVGGGRKIHSGSIPRIAGPAIAISVLVPIVGVVFINNEITEAWNELGLRGWGIIICAFAACLLGLIDDIHYIRARNKLIVQIAIAVIAFYLGLQIRVLNLPFIGNLEMGTFALPVTVFWFLGFMNMVNLIDGMDGLCGGIVAIASVAVFVVALSQGALVVALFSVAIFGALLGFLKYNFTPASIFMGDSGSYFLGFILAAISITGSHKSTVVVAIAAPVLALGIPILDTVMAITRRLIAGRPIFAPDRGHMHHVLIDKGHSTRKAVGVFYTISFLMALSGIVMVTGEQYEIGIALATSILVIIYLLKIVQPKGPSNTGATSSHLIASKADEVLAQVPEFLIELNDAPSVRAMSQKIQTLGKTLGLSSLTLEIRNDQTSSIAWRINDESVPLRGTELALSYPLQTGSYQLGQFSLSWHSERSRPCPETKAVLQFMALMIGQHVLRLQEPVTEESLVSESEPRLNSTVVP